MNSSMKSSPAKRSSAGRRSAPRTPASVLPAASCQSGDGDTHWTSCLISSSRAPHQMLPAPGVYDALMMLLQMTVSACTTPLNLDIPASTLKCTPLSCT